MFVKLIVTGFPPAPPPNNILRDVFLWVCIPLVLISIFLIFFTVSGEDEVDPPKVDPPKVDPPKVVSTEIISTEPIREPKIPLLFNVQGPYQKIDNNKVQSLSSAMALPAVLVLFNVDGNINIGMCIRSAASLKFTDVYIVGKNKRDRRGEVGATKYIRVHKLPNIDMGFFEKEGLVPILVEQGGTPLEDMKFNKYFPRNCPKVAFVVGAEDCGIPVEFIKAAKTKGYPFISISQYGVMRSLNVSIAASIVMYEYTKQWRSSVITACL